MQKLKYIFLTSFLLIWSSLSWSEEPPPSHATSSGPTDYSYFHSEPTSTYLGTYPESIDGEPLFIANDTCGNSNTGEDNYSVLIKIKDEFDGKRLKIFKKMRPSTGISDYSTGYIDPLKINDDYIVDVERGWLLLRNLSSNQDYNYYLTFGYGSWLAQGVSKITSRARIYCQNKTNLSATIPIRTISYNSGLNRNMYYVYASTEALKLMASSENVSYDSVVSMLGQQVRKQMRAMKVAESMFAPKYDPLGGSQATLFNPQGLAQTWGAGPLGETVFLHKTIEENNPGAVVYYNRKRDVVRKDQNGGSSVEETVILSAECDESGCVFHVAPSIVETEPSNPSDGPGQLPIYSECQSGQACVTTLGVVHGNPTVTQGQALGLNLDIVRFPRSYLPRLGFGTQVHQRNSRPSAGPGGDDNEYSNPLGYDFDRVFSDVQLSLPGPEFDITAPPQVGGPGMPTEEEEEEDDE